MRAPVLTFVLAALAGPASADLYRCDLAGGVVVATGPAGAGPPCRALADPVGDLGLDASAPSDLAAAVAALTERLDAQDAEIQRLRARLARLIAGDVAAPTPLVPPDAMDRALGEAETRDRVRSQGRELDRKLDALRPEPPLGPSRR